MHMNSTTSYAVIFFNGDAASKCTIARALVSRGIFFMYTGEYIRLRPEMTRERLRLELERCLCEEDLACADMGIEVVRREEDGITIRTISELKPFYA